MGCDSLFDVQFNSLTLELDAPFLGLLLTQILKKKLKD